MPHAALFQEHSVILDLTGEDPEGILGQLVDRMVDSQDSLAARRDEVLQALISRESEGSTGSQGVGIPHVKLGDFEQVAVAIGVHQEGIDFAALDGEPVHVFIAVVRPAEQQDEHLQMMRWIAGIAQHQDFVSFAKQAQDVQQVLDLLTELAPA